MKKTLIIANILFSIFGFSQQEVQVSQYMLNPYLINPAEVAIADYFETNLSYRAQWVGMEGNPETMILTSQTTVGKPRWGRTHPGDWHGWHGIGGTVIKDKIGAYSNTKVQASYAYNVKLTQGAKYGYNHKDGLRFSLGISGGWNQYKTDKEILGKTKNSSFGNRSNIATLTDPTYARLAKNTAGALDMTIGGMLYFSETYYLGFSSSQIFQSKVKMTEASTLARHYFLTGKIKMKVNGRLFIIPSFLLKAVSGAPLSIDLGTRFDWDDKYYLGVAYRHQDAVTAMVGYRLKIGEKVKHFRIDKHRYIFRFYYSYDLTISRLANKNLVNKSNGSHEVTVSFLLPPMYHERNAEDTW